jgi:hypothetical protein
MFNGKSIHIIYNQSGECEALTISDSVAKKAMESGMTVEMNEQIVVAALETSLEGWTQKLGDREWKLVAPIWKSELCQVISSDPEGMVPTFCENPPDLPPHLALRRLDVLDQHGNKVDLLSKIELTEMVMAFRNGRQVNLNLFGPASLSGAPFYQGAHIAKNKLQAQLKDLNHNYEKLNGRLGEEASKQGSVSDESWEEVSKLLLMKSVELNEMAYIVAEKTALGEEIYTFHDLWAEFGEDEPDFDLQITTH